MDGTSIITSVTPPIQLAPHGQRQGKSEPVAADHAQNPKPTTNTELAPSEIKQLEQLKRRDREVRAHEMAHKATAGQYAKGGASFEYQQGPDGQRYAVGGEVSIDIAKESDPQQTLQKALVIKRAALAPADPSGQDRQIALQADQMAAEARQEIRQQEQELTSRETNPSSGEKETDPASKTDDTSNTEQDPTPAQRRAIDSFHRVANLDQPPPQLSFDQFI
jgi:hypothetical protein